MSLVSVFSPFCLSWIGGKHRHVIRHSTIAAVFLLGLWLADSKENAAFRVAQASVLKMKSHDRRIVAAVLVAWIPELRHVFLLRVNRFYIGQAMTLLALLLGLMAFLLGRGACLAGLTEMRGSLMPVMSGGRGRRQQGRVYDTMTC